MTAFVNSATTSCSKSGRYSGDPLCHRFRPLYITNWIHSTTALLRPQTPSALSPIWIHSTTALLSARSLTWRPTLAQIPSTLNHKFRQLYDRVCQLCHYLVFKVRSLLWRPTLWGLPGLPGQHGPVCQGSVSPGCRRWAGSRPPARAARAARASSQLLQIRN